MKFILTCLLILIVPVTWAQNLVNQSTIYISNNSVLFVSGDLTNNGLIINNGDMQVGGAWINNNQYDAGIGKITFNSDLPQIINHNAQSFSRLTISGGGVKNFLADITIEDELELTDGTLVSQNGAAIVFASGSTITGGSNSAHITGPVYHIGSGDKLFPIGNGTTYLPVTLLNVSSAEVGIAMVEFNGSPALLTSEELNEISNIRYWTIDLVTGNLAGSLIKLPVVNENGLITDTERAIVSESGSLNDPFTSLGQSLYEGTASTGFITSAESVTGTLVALATASEENSIFVYNAISPNPNVDDKNSFLRIQNITFYPQNRVMIFNRWGDKVFEMNGYDNDQRVFRGITNVGGSNELSAGTYFYSIDKGDGSKVVTGFISLRR